MDAQEDNGGFSLGSGGPVEARRLVKDAVDLIEIDRVLDGEGSAGDEVVDGEGEDVAVVLLGTNDSVGVSLDDGGLRREKVLGAVDVGGGELAEGDSSSEVSDEAEVVSRGGSLDVRGRSAGSVVEEIRVVLLDGVRAQEEGGGAVVSIAAVGGREGVLLEDVQAGGVVGPVGEDDGGETSKGEGSSELHSLSFFFLLDCDVLCCASSSLEGVWFWSFFRVVCDCGTKMTRYQKEKKKKRDDLGDVVGNSETMRRKG